MIEYARDALVYAQSLSAVPKLIISIVVVLVALLVLYLLWFDATKIASNERSNGHLAPVDKIIVWDGHLGHTYSGSGAGLRTSALQIGVKNNLGHELRLERAYAVSGEGAGEKEMEVAAGESWVSAERLRPLGNQQSLVLRMLFDSELARDVFENWKTFQITLIYNGGLISRKDVTEKMVRAVYESFKPSPIGPQVRTK